MAETRPSHAGAVLLGCGLAVLVIGPLVAQYVGEPFYIRLFTRIAVMAIAAVSLDLILGYGGMVSFGHAAFVGIGAYVTAILAYHAAGGEPLLAWPITLTGTDNAFIAWPLAIAAAALAALIIGLVSLRTTGIAFIMITLAFAQMLYFFVIALQKYGGEDGLQMAGRSRLGGLDLDGRLTFYYLVLALLVAVILFCRRLVESRFGMVLQGCRQNERRLQAIGFATGRYRLAAFVISGAIAGLAGVLLANGQNYVSPADMAWTRSGEYIVMVVFGGMGTLIGPLLGAAAYLVLELLLGSATTHWQAIFGPVLIVIVLFAKRGLYGALTRRAGDG